MSEPTILHPDAQDLLNLAQEKLGKKKSQRILDHCKDCPACADALLEAVREHAPKGERQPITRWQWISIGLFIVALVAVVVAMVWFVRSAASSTSLIPGRAESAAGSSRTPISESRR